MKNGYSKAAQFLAGQAITLLGSSIVQFAIIMQTNLLGSTADTSHRTAPQNAPLLPGDCHGLKASQ